MKLLFAADFAFSYATRAKHFVDAEKALGSTAKLFSQYDFTMLNLESIMGNENDYTPIVKDGPNLMASPYFESFIDILHPTVIGLANNHTYDYGEAALLANIERLKSKSYTVVGAGKTLAEAYEPAIYEKDGVKIAIIASCENEFCSASDTHGGSAGYRLGMVTEAIEKSKKLGALPIIYFHGGNERNPVPSPKKVELYRHFVDLGAKAVIAMHTHCPQGSEVYKNCPIVYSMGNFFFPKDLPSLPTWSVGYLSELTLEDSNFSLRKIPYEFDFDSLTLLEGEKKEKALAYLDMLSDIIKDEKLVADYFDAWCMFYPITWVKNGIAPAVENAETMKFPKNIFGCEAHNEALTNLFVILYEERAEEAKKLIPNIEKMQNLEMI